MTAKKLYHRLISEIKGYSAQETTEIAFWLLDHFLGLDKTAILIDKPLMVDTIDWQKIIARLNLQEPIQHIIGQIYFEDLHLFVSPAVLIPRPETAEMLRLIQALHIQPKHIIDIGTGSGCLALGLAKHFKNAQVLAVDISAAALSVAEKNAKLNDIKNIDFEEIDILSLPEIPQKFDLIVSNPPYIAPSEQHSMNANVLQYEPYLALFAPEQEPLIFYKAIAQFAKKHLSESGQIWVEINEQFGSATAQVFQEAGFQQTQIHLDFLGKERFVVGC